ncbi:Lipase 2 [Hondaea fermentalgiana]|uniref:Lipase 2 n=1 Tax=Hondaea fermentalgiana TaxID=2315210 RepID=A0A2R5GHF8_9STRA|nr:Lipase 2 [Hondaea fermentalgiana]|eukprot:GBG27304.1 Lipase 2 [Hondaea fermentalgiana]
MGHVHERAAQLQEQISGWEEREKGERVILEEFNPACQNSPDVEYYSVSGIADPETAAAIIRPIFKIMLREEGASDGLVSLESSKWGTHLGTFPVDHIEQIFLTPPAIAMYHSLLEAVDPEKVVVPPAKDVAEAIKASEQKLHIAQDPSAPTSARFMAS